MIKLLGSLPKKVTVACSGGVDSMAVLDFLSKKHDVICAFYHHGTDSSEQAMKFISNFCTIRKIPVFFGILLESKPKRKSYEEFWREKRYEFLDSIKVTPVITCHHLDDCVETYLWGCMHGTPKIIPYRRNNIIRPFLTTRKQEFINWCERKNIDWCHDSSNDDTDYTRNYIRHELMPHALKVNPGLHKVVKRIVEKNVIMDILKQ